MLSLNQPIPSRSAALGRFRGFGSEKEETIRRPGVVEDRSLAGLIGSWDAIKRLGAYPQALDKRFVDEHILSIEYSARDVERFSIHLVEFQDEPDFTANAGRLLSLLINHGKDEAYTIHTRHLDRRNQLDCLGYGNTKTLIIEGDTGSYCGGRMISGSISVMGSTGMKCGEDMVGGNIQVMENAGFGLGNRMEGGSISVKGNADELCGLWMGGGSIEVFGNAGAKCGEEMEGGEIRVHGKIEYVNLFNKQGGEIYEKGRLVGIKW